MHGTKLLLTPTHIDTTRHFAEAFGDSMTEVSARWIVQYMQQNGEGQWKPFTLEEIQEFYDRKHEDKHQFEFNGLLGTWITRDDEGRYEVTDDFVHRCFNSFPDRDPA